jgi:hypothetical protein
MSGSAKTTFKVTFTSGTGSIVASGYDRDGVGYEFNFDAGRGWPQEYSIDEQSGPHTVSLVGSVPVDQPATFDITGENGESLASHQFSGNFGPTQIAYINDTGPE